MDSSRKSTIKEIAFASGLSTATVDRVLNRRQGVRAATVAKVEHAMESLQRIAERRVSERVWKLEGNGLRIGFVVQTGRAFSELAQQILMRAKQRFSLSGVELTFIVIEQANPILVARAIRQSATVNDGLAVISFEHRAINSAINDIVSAGAAVVCLTTDLPDSLRHSYIGPNHFQAGRTAALLMQELAANTAGEIVIVSGRKYRSQEERERGFRAYIGEKCPNLCVRETIDVQNDPEIAHERILRLVRSTSAPAGIYAVGGGVAGIARALRECSSGNAPFLIAHELNGETRDLVLSGEVRYIIDQDLVSEIQAAVEQIQIAKSKIETDPAIKSFAPIIVTRENMDSN